MFFFFKQKTAYEMRISDWSSDVCSSDLDLAIVGPLHRAIDQQLCAVEQDVTATDIFAAYGRTVPPDEPIAAIRRGRCLPHDVDLRNVNDRTTESLNYEADFCAGVSSRNVVPPTPHFFARKSVL